MTDSEKDAMREMLKRQQAGWAYLEEERKESIRNADTQTSIYQLDDVFDFANRQHERPRSGLTEFYRNLAKLERRCSS